MVFAVETPLLEDVRLFEAFYEAKIANSLVKLPAEGLTPSLRPSQLPGILRNFVQNKLFEVPAVYKWHYSGYTVKKDPRGEMVSDYESAAKFWEPLTTFRKPTVYPPRGSS